MSNPLLSKVAPLFRSHMGMMILCVGLAAMAFLMVEPEAEGAGTWSLLAPLGLCLVMHFFMHRFMHRGHCEKARVAEAASRDGGERT